MVEYLSSAPELTKHVAAGLADIAQLKAADPIAQLGQYLIKLADNLERSKAIAAAAAEDEITAAASRVKSISLKQKADASAEEKRRHEGRLKSLLADLNSATVVDPLRMIKTLSELKDLTSASSAYICEGFGVGEAAETANAGETAATSHIRYIASTPDHEWIKRETLKSTEQGVLWKLWDIVAAASEPEATEDAAAGTPAASATAASASAEPMYIPSVLAHPGVVFHRLPRAGAFMAVPITYSSVIHDGAMMSESEESEAAAAHAAAEEERIATAEAAAREEEEEAAAAAAQAQSEESEGVDAAEPAPQPASEARSVIPPARPAPPPSKSRARHLALCIDTVDSAANNAAGPPRGLDLAAREAAVAVAEALRSAFQRTEAARFTLEHDALVAARAKGRTPEVIKEDAAIGKASVSAVAKLSEDVPDDTKRLVDATARLAAARKLLASPSRRADFRAFLSRRISPGPEGLRVLQAALLLHGLPVEALADATLPTEGVDWQTVRALLRESSSDGPLIPPVVDVTEDAPGAMGAPTANDEGGLAGAFWERVLHWDPSSVEAAAEQSAEQASSRSSNAVQPSGGVQLAPPAMRASPATLRALLEGLLPDPSSPPAQDTEDADAGAEQQAEAGPSATLRETCTLLLPLAQFVAAALDAADAAKAKREREAEEAAAAAAAAKEAAAEAAAAAQASADEAAAAAADEAATAAAEEESAPAAEGETE